MKFTVLGSTGFIGTAMVRSLRASGADVITPPRSAENLKAENLGHVIYAIGMTGNFREKPAETIDAHVNVLRRLMDGADFESWLYLSSTRVYAGLAKGIKATEDAVLSIKPNADTLYDLSKLLGESICLSHKKETVRVARLSNVYGPGQSEHTFLGSILRDLHHEGKAVINQSPDSSKDYIRIDAVVDFLRLIALQGRERLYNVASGHSVTHKQIADTARQGGYTINFTVGAPTRIFPPADIGKISREFGKKIPSLTDDLPRLIGQNQNTGHKNHEKISR